MATIKLTNQILYNLQVYLDRMFLENGYYYPVSRGELRGTLDMSQLEGQTGLSEYDDYAVWQSAFKPWVYEGGVDTPSGQAAIMAPSGVWIDDVFTDTGLHYDYNGGRVIFDAALDGDETVQIAGMTFKQIYVNFPETDLSLLDKTQLKNQDNVSDLVTYPSSHQIQPPAVYIDWFGDWTQPYQLGGGLQHVQKLYLHVFAEDMFIVNDILDILMNKRHTGFTMANWNTIPERFDVYGDLASTYKEYSYLQTNYAYKKLYFDNVAIKKISIDGPLKRALVEMETLAYVASAE
jgi:hypothetical protein